MNWLYKLLGIKDDTPPKSSANGKLRNDITNQESILPGPDLTRIGHIRLGRYSDNNKSHEKTLSWYIAEDKFKEKKYTEALEAFFEYLRDEPEDNMLLTREGDRFDFTLLQGSKKVHGTIDGGKIVAKAPLALMEQPSTAVMRRLLEMNYSLYYSHSGMDEGNTLYMVFLSDIASTNPSKLYYGLRELATKADRQDDLLLADFSGLQATDSEHIQFLPEHELEIKFRYFRKWIGETLDSVSELNQDSFSGAIAYLLLTLIYRIDFLMQPESRLLAELEKINGLYWDKKDEITLVERNQMMKDAIRKLLDFSKEDFSRSLYRSKSTFSIAAPPKAEKVRDHIMSANKDSRWYIENKYPHIALVINEYGMLYNQFIYSMPKVQTELVALYMIIRHHEYFRELGMTVNFLNTINNELHQTTIKTTINQIIERYQQKFKQLKWNNNEISYTSLYDFGIDISEQIAGLNLEIKRAS